MKKKKSTCAPKDKMKNGSILGESRMLIVRTQSYVVSIEMVYKQNMQHSNQIL